MRSRTVPRKRSLRFSMLDEIGPGIAADGFGEGGGEWRERISLAGPLVAYRDYGCDEDLCIESYTYIRVLDLRSETETACRRPSRFRRTPTTKSVPFACAVTARSRGRPAEPPPRRCRSGKLVRLLVASPGSAPGLLDIGRDLDPFSPRWKGTRLRWTRAGRARSVSVP